MSRIGLLSDSHGRAEAARAGVALLTERGAQRLVHLGDVGTVEVLDALLVEGEAGTIPAHVVFGNTDWNAGELERYAQSMGLSVDHPMGRLAVEGGELAFCHGHEWSLMEQALEAGVRYLCHGHTHRQRDERVGSTRVINPGALHRAAEHTVALLDTGADALHFYRLG